MLTAEQLHWILNRPEVRESARIRDRRVGVKRDNSPVSASARPKAESIDGGVLIDGGQDSEEECEIF